MTRYSVRVIQKHRSQLDPIPWQIIRLNRKNQLTWGVIKFLIGKNMGQFKNKSYTYDIDGKYYDDYANIKNEILCVLSNLAGGLVCEYAGVVRINKEILLSIIDKTLY